ncbi:hypothetical protein TruAng_004758 [Truncatella angustata]|nr:hypothetical protein TruAng_004758 [Truncatella angustata]
MHDMADEPISEPLQEKAVDIGVAESKEVNNDSSGRPSSPSRSPDPHGRASPESAYQSGPRLWLTLSALSFVIILGGLDFSIVGVAVPAITEEFHTIADVGWYSVSYRLTACVCQFAWGQLYTIFSVRRVLAVAIIVFLIGSAVAAAATSSVMFVVGRAISGVGSAGVLGGTFTAIMVVAPLRIRPVLTSLLSALEAVAMVTGPIIGGVLTQHTTWRWCFYLNLPVGGAALVFLVLFLTDAPPPGAEQRTLNWKQILVKMDIVSNIFLTGSLTCLFMVLSWAGINYEWSSATIIGLLVTFAVGFFIFVFVEYRRGNEGTLPARIVKQRSVAAGAWFSCCLNGALGVLEYYIPIYFQVVLGWSPAKAGYMMLPVTVGFNIGLLIQGFGTTWLGYYNPFMIMSSVILPIGAGLVTTWTKSSSLAPFIVFSGMIGLGSGLGFEVPQIAVQTVLPEDDGALGLSVTLFAQNFGGALFISIAQQVFTAKLLDNLRDKLPDLTATAIQNLSFIDLPGSSLTSGSQDIIAGSFKQIWYVAVVLACLMAIGSVATQWRSVKGDPEADTP